MTQNAAHLGFPFKRYQIQKVWRGERPQEGRFREFTQADIDVVGQGALPFHHEGELPLFMAAALLYLQSIGVPAATIHANNRKLSEGFYRGLGLEDVDSVLREIDKLDKIGPSAVAQELAASAGATAVQADACLELAEILATTRDELEERVRTLAGRHHVGGDLLDEGVGELGALLDGAEREQPGALVADLRIARGLDYYTGSVYETFLDGRTDFGSVCSGGRYDRLAQVGSQAFPGVGLSIGISRLVSRLLAAGVCVATRPTPTVVLVAVGAEESRGASSAIAATFRSRGISADVAPTAARFGQQIRYADRTGIPFVWFPGADGKPDEVKDIRSGDQGPAQAVSWQPPADDLAPRVVPGPGAAGRPEPSH